MRVDVTEQAGLEAARDLALDRFGRVDIVMNNVGVVAVGPPEDIPLDAWQRIIDINLLSLVRSGLVFLPAARAGSGHVINTASMTGLFPYAFAPERLPYVATKYAVVGVTEARGSDFPMVRSDEAVELVVEAVAADRFLVLTAPAVAKEVRERGANMDAYIQGVIKALP